MTRDPVYVAVAVAVESLHVQLYLPKTKKTGANESQIFGLLACFRDPFPRDFQ